MPVVYLILFVVFLVIVWIVLYVGYDSGRSSMITQEVAQQHQDKLRCVLGQVTEAAAAFRKTAVGYWQMNEAHVVAVLYKAERCCESAESAAGSGNWPAVVYHANEGLRILQSLREEIEEAEKKLAIRRKLAIEEQPHDRPPTFCPDVG